MVEYSDAISDTMFSAPRQAVLLAGGAAFRSTDGMGRTMADIPASRRSLYDLCGCGAVKRTKAARCQSCREQQRSSASERFWANVDKTAGCWVWSGGRSTRGYGRFWMDGRRVQAHRVAFEWMRGPIPEGLELDHLCRVRECVRPDHLEPVTTAENLRRGYSPTGINQRKTVCKHGHPLDGLRKSGPTLTRYCTTCKARLNASWRERHRPGDLLALAAKLTEATR